MAILGRDLASDIAARVTTLADRHRTCPARELVANGFWSESRYYAALARHCDVRFVTDWPMVAGGFDPVTCAARGRVRLIDGTWIIAPQGGDLALLCTSRRTGRDFALTTPAHLLALLHRAGQPALARLAADDLPDAAPHLSARGVASRTTACLAGATAVACLASMVAATRLFCDALGIVFFAAMCLRLLASAGGRAPFDAPPPPVGDADLVPYTVLVPLSREAAILPQLLDALAAIDYPRAKLQVLILVEPEDCDTRDALAASMLPPWIHVVLGPVGGDLRTKPRALNLGLAAARGSIVTVYDAEDRPAPDQLRRAAAHFATDPGLACLQARLAMVAEDGAPLLDRLFAIEYAALFSTFNLGLARAALPIPLGGTSNHFRIDALRHVGGWDAWNVTEDADLGLRLARFGYRVDCLDSTTFETPPHALRDWWRQRRRWTKGWTQTLLVLVGDLPRTVRDLGVRRAFVVGLILINLVVGTLALPVCSVWFAFQLISYGLPTPRTPLEVAEATLATSVLLTGLFSPIWCGHAGLRADGRLALAPWLPLLLPYQLMIAAAAWWGLWDLLVRPFHWHKTPHLARRTNS